PGEEEDSGTALTVADAVADALHPGRNGVAPASASASEFPRIFAHTCRSRAVRTPQRTFQRCPSGIQYFLVAREEPGGLRAVRKRELARSQLRAHCYDKGYA